MARRTSRDSFRTLVQSARDAIPHLNLSTDLIVGFPGETEADFAETLDYVAEMAFSRLHVFSYSQRPGTSAAKMPDQVKKAVKKEHTSRLIALGHELSLAFHQQYEGQLQNVLWESSVGADKDGLRWLGYTDNYIRVQAMGPSDLFNRVTPTYLFEARPEGMNGRLPADA